MTKMIKTLTNWRCFQIKKCARWPFMPWFKVDDGFPSSRQILSIPPRQRCRAAGLWTLAGAWSAKELTDGFIPRFALREFGATPSMAKLLVDAGLWEVTDGGWNFIGWDRFQFTKATVLDHRQNEKERKKRAREHSQLARETRAEQEIMDNVRPESGRRPGGIRPVSHPDSALPDQTRPDPLPITTYVRGDVTSVGPRCPRHIDDPDPPPCGACADARRANDTAKQTQDSHHASQRAANRAAIDDCSLCDDRGLIDTDGDEVTRCTHRAVIHA